jgi:hypothetical protein
LELIANDNPQRLMKNTGERGEAGNLLMKKCCGYGTVAEKYKPLLFKAHQ